MKLLLDECLSPRVASLLIDGGHDVATVGGALAVVGERTVAPGRCVHREQAGAVGGADAQASVGVQHELVRVARETIMTNPQDYVVRGDASIDDVDAT